MADQPPYAAPRQVSNKFETCGPGPGTWIAACAGLLMITPGLFALVLAGISKSKSSAASKAWDQGDALTATRLAGTADTLRMIAIVALLVPFAVFALFIAAVIAVSVLGTTA